MHGTLALVRVGSSWVMGSIEVGLVEGVWLASK